MASVISSLQGLTALPAGAFWTTMKCAVMDWASDVQIVDVSKGRAALDAVWAGCSAGQVFGGEAELKWVRRGSGYHAVLISDAGERLEGSQNAKGVTKEGEPRPALLWGKRGGDLLYEDRIPREFVLAGDGDPERNQLRYPADIPEINDGGRLAVLVQRYRMSIEVPEMTGQGVQHREQAAAVSRWTKFIAAEGL